MNHLRHSDPAERNALMRLPYRNWRPTRLGRWGKAPAGAAVVGPYRISCTVRLAGEKSAMHAI